MLRRVRRVSRKQVHRVPLMLAPGLELIAMVRRVWHSRGPTGDNPRRALGVGEVDHLPVDRQSADLECWHQGGSATVIEAASIVPLSPPVPVDGGSRTDASSA